MLPPLNLPLTDAVEAGDLATVKKLIAGGTNINEKDHGGWTPFLKACEYGHLEIAQELKKAGADINAPSSFKWTALMKASEGGHLDVVKWLIDEGVDVNVCQNDDKHSALWLAVANGRVPVCEYLADHGAHLDHVDRESTPMLIHATYRGKLKSVKFLVSRGADLAIRCKNYGNTAFLTACMWAHPKILKYLAKTDKNFDVTQVNQYGQNAGQLTTRTPNLEVLTCLFELGFKIPADDPQKSPLYGCGDLECCKFILAQGSSVAGQSGVPALGYAAYNGRLDVVKLLIAHGADPKLKNKDGHDALDMANKAWSKTPAVEATIAYLAPLVPKSA